MDAVRGVYPTYSIRCTPNVLNALTRETAPTYLAAPTGGVMANWTIVNVQSIFTFSEPAAAFEVRESFIDATSTVVDRAVPERVVFWDQNGTPLSRTETEANTADLLVRGDTPVRTAVRSDLPDLSTPYLQDALLAAKAPLRQVFALSNTIVVAEVGGEYFTLDSVGAATDWVLTFPTRHYFAAVNYGPPATILRTSVTEGNYYFLTGNTVIGDSFNGGAEYQLCARSGFELALGPNREGRSDLLYNWSLGALLPQSPAACGATFVFGVVNQGRTEISATFGAVARSRVLFLSSFTEGWMLLSAHSLSVPDGSSPSRAYGLPYLGTQFTRFSNTQANVHYGVTYPLSMRKRGYWAENGYDGPPF